ncbi:predicted protein [Sclerotinia sclerotiorum 1980 UF-70]|uniref:Uncharacterized protein n=1 Tax=Sclerotinia sclerotiorum (strain ATCC 18683 / 1980 / Ss-1) TaxID=665079 RepID=A7F0I3_SCLS1|nr:predicted protein [Sclerotinia sclerotiorum 1980 UF-70]EDN95225.1 predicted protein [Sclerotinia sclerotiorum 1980 UF-70]
MSVRSDSVVGMVVVSNMLLCISTRIFIRILIWKTTDSIGWSRYWSWFLYILQNKFCSSLFLSERSKSSQVSSNTSSVTNHSVIISKS